MGYALESGVVNSLGQSQIEIVKPIVSPSTPNVAYGADGVKVVTGPTDPISNLPVFISYDHHQIHEGESWKWDILISNLAIGSSYDIVFTVPNISIPSNANNITLCPHFRWSAEANDLCNLFLYEAPTVTAATGSARSPINLERNGTYTPKLTILDSPTITAVGTLIDADYFLQASLGVNEGGGASLTTEEFILKNNTKYLFRVTSGANGCDIHAEFFWYEDLGV